MELLSWMNVQLMLLLALCFGYQILFLLVPFFKRERPHGPETLHRFAVLISARNEEAVIGQLIQSIRLQDYPAHLIDIFVVADNCTDATASVARQAGAAVWERFDTRHVGKGWALEYLFARLDAEYQGPPFDGYLIFDADNLLCPDYITQMNRTFSDGYSAVTSYRNSKNYGDSWVSAGHGLWFLRGADFLNRSRMLLGTSSVISGTGFLLSRQALEQLGGWHFHLLTEDLQLTAHLVLRGISIGYCHQAVFYDEQPVRFLQSCHQRLRWVKGSLQVLAGYGPRLLEQLVRTRRFACFDLVMSMVPAVVPVAAGLLLNGVALFLSPPEHWATAAVPSPALLLKALLPALAMGCLITFAQWRALAAPAGKKLGYILTFPLFLATFVPISAAAFVLRVRWTPIPHTCSRSIDELRPTG